MAETTGISWADATFNLWWGCVEVSPACDHCYAREWATRKGFDVWGPQAPRRFFGDEHWKGPLQWNRAAAKERRRRRVFCMSMGDIGEARHDDVGAAMDRERERLWALILNTPWLDWLLLTKRPQFYRTMPPALLAMPNVWPGTTVESAEYLWRLDALGRIDAEGPTWVSYEPALGPVNFRSHLARGLGWVIAGGESKQGRDHQPRPMHPAWALDARDQAVEAGKPYHFKQWGYWVPYEETAPLGTKCAAYTFDDGQEMTDDPGQRGWHGRRLAGREWNEVPG